MLRWRCAILFLLCGCASPGPSALPDTAGDGTDDPSGPSGAASGARARTIRAPLDTADTGGGTGAADADGDGYDGVAAGGTDCDDSDAGVNPGAAESCNAADDDCDGTADESGCACTHATDGLHDFLFCATPRSWADAQADCDGWGYRLADVEDSTENLWIWSQAELVRAGNAWWLGLNDRDIEGTFAWESGSTAAYREWRAGEPNNFNSNEDCGKYHINGGGLWNDANCADAILYICEAGCVYTDSYLDSDGDGWGDPATATRGCGTPAGQVAAGGDCDDADAAIHPGVLEACGGADEDCDGLTDDADPALDPASATAWYADADGDGHDAGVAGYACLRPAGAAASAGDCDDADPGAFPGAPEVRADGIDQDCDGAIDDPDSAIPVCPCAQAALGAHSYLFCAETATWQGAQDACLALGYDIVQIEDSGENAWIWATAEGTDAVSSWWIGLSDSDSTGAAEGAFGWPDGTGLDDWDFSAWRAGEPNDYDADGDGVGEDCARYTDNAAGLWNDSDCAAEVYYVCEAGCAIVLSWPDADGDGSGDAALPVAGCEAGAGMVTVGGDCDDSDPSVGPGGAEVCGGGDEDCDGLTDDADPSIDPAGQTRWYPDGDGDGWGVESGDVTACLQPAGFVAQSGDCDDRNAATHPGATEVNDGIDNDCDGYTELQDADGDGLNHLLEQSIGSDPYDPDTDGDGLSDGDEVTIDGGAARDTDGDGAPDWNDTDDDGDGVPTAGECGDTDLSTPPPDTDGDGITDPLDEDSDGDTLWDGTEAGKDSDGDGADDRIDPDDDGDGIPTGIEATVDTDGDGGSDFDVDGDGTPNHLDDDTDGDGCPDSAEGDGDGNGDGLPDFADQACGEQKEEVCGCASGGSGAALPGLLLLMAARRRQRCPSPQYRR